MLDGLLDANLDAPANEEETESIVRQAKEIAQALPSAVRSPAPQTETSLEERLKRLMES